MFWSPKLSKKKKERNTLNIHQKKEKIIQTSFERDERDKTLTCDGFRRVEEEEEEDESSPSFFFLLRWRVHPNDLVRARRKRRQNRDEEEEKVSTFLSFRKCFKLLGTTTFKLGRLLRGALAGFTQTRLVRVFRHRNEFKARRFEWNRRSRPSLRDREKERRTRRIFFPFFLGICSSLRSLFFVFSANADDDVEEKKPRERGRTNNSQAGEQRM